MCEISECFGHQSRSSRNRCRERCGWHPVTAPSSPWVRWDSHYQSQRVDYQERRNCDDAREVASRRREELRRTECSEERKRSTTTLLCVIKGATRTPHSSSHHRSQLPFHPTFPLLLPRTSHLPPSSMVKLRSFDGLKTQKWP